MESAESTNELAKARRAFAARIARIAITEGGLDRRDGLALSSVGVITLGQTTVSESELQSILNAGDIAGHDGLGPLIIYEHENGSRSASRARDLLLDHNPEIRRKAVSHLRRLVAAGGALSAPTIAALDRDGDTIVDGPGTSWQAPAIDLADSLDSDWLLNVAGMRQCRHPSLAEAWNEYTSAALTPATPAIQACFPAELCPGLHAKKLDERLAAWRSDRAASASLAERYLGTVGHVPLDVNRALSSFGCSTAEAAELQQWASEHPNPVAKYHFLEAVFAASVPSADAPRAAEWFWETVLPGRPDQDGTRLQEAWRLIHQLARYYLHSLEVAVPTDSSEAVAAMSWWMAGRLVSTLTGNASQLRHFGEQLAEHRGGVTSAVWDLVAPAMNPSLLAWLTASGPSPWAASVVVSIQSQEQAAWLWHAAGPGSKEERMQGLVAMAMQLNNLPLDGSSGMYRFSAGITRFLGWAAESESDAERKKVLKGWSENIDWSRPESLQEALKDLQSRDPEIQVWFSHAIHERMALGALSGESLWAIVSADTWRAQSWPKLDSTAALAIGYALIDAAARERPDWGPRVPHLFVDITETRVDDQSHVGVGLVLRACGRLGMTSALTRLLRGNQAHRFRPMATQVQGNIEQALPLTGRWAGGRLRALLSAL